MSTSIYQTCKLNDVAKLTWESIQGWAQIKSWFDLNGFWGIFIWFDLIWRVFLITWFDLIWFDAFLKSRDLIWFDLTPFSRDLIWFDSNFRNHYRCIFGFKSSIQAKPMAPTARARRELSIGARFVYETSISSSLWLGFGITRNDDLKSESNHDLIWFDLICARFFASWFDLIWRFSKNRWFDLIWFENILLLRRFDLIWFEFAHPWFNA